MDETSNLWSLNSLFSLIFCLQVLNENVDARGRKQSKLYNLNLPSVKIATIHKAEN